MQIHRILPGERVSDIAKMQGISEEIIRKTNELGDSEGAVGEELFIPTPTRCYTVQHGDTLDRIALRFGIKKGDIVRLNPWLRDGKLDIGQMLALKQEEPRGGMAVANGYFYKGCTEEKLRRAMPYLTYITFAEAMADERGIRRTADMKREVGIALEEGKTPLVRVYDRYADRYKSEGDQASFAEALIELAKEGGYKGIVLDACVLGNSANEFMSFLMILRKMMIGCDLILITEVNEKSPIEFSEYADGSVVYYPKYAFDSPLSFEEGERKVFSDFACRGESAKAFIDLPSLARGGNEFITTDAALKRARKQGCEIKHNENTLLSRIGDRRQGEYSFASLKNIKALLDLASEFDYMGICFDIMRTPLNQLMMYNSMFKTSYPVQGMLGEYVRSVEGCSRADEE